MVKLSALPRIAYLILIIAGFAAILVVASFSETSPQETALTTGPEQILAATDGSRAETGQAAPPATSEAEPIRYDHHGNPIREDPIYEKVVGEGVSVEFTAENFLGVGGRGGEIAAELFEGEFARLKFRISQADSTAAIPGLRPSVWMELRRADPTGKANPAPSCQERVRAYLSGALTSRPDINLNSYFILALNNDSSISVIDPMIDVAGMTNLFALLDLPQPGYDWAISADQQQLFVTIPATDQVAVANLEQFRVVQHLEAGRNPTRVVFQPDQKYVWVGNDAATGDASGVTVINPVGLKVMAQLSTGAGHHELAFSADSRFAFVTNSNVGTLSVIDTEQLAPVKTLNIGPQPVAVAVSAQTGALYVAEADRGEIVVLDGRQLNELARIKAAPGLAAVHFAPGGRWGFALNPRAGQVTIFDTASNTVSASIAVTGGPDQIAFSQTHAYIRTGSAPEVTSISLADLETGQTPVPVNLSIGQSAASDFPNPAAAAAMLATPADGAMIMANPADDQIYYYVEGAQAAQGGFQGHGLFPRAVQIIDRSLREEAPGVYAGSVRLPYSGTYDVAFLLDNPRIVHCFAMTVNPNPNSTTAAAESLPKLEVLTAGEPLKVGRLFKLQFELTDPATGLAVAGLTDVLVLANQTGGNWNQQYVARWLAEGRYEVDLTVPAPGLYNILFAIPSLQVNFDGFPNLNLKAANGEVGN